MSTNSVQIDDQSAAVSSALNGTIVDEVDAFCRAHDLGDLLALSKQLATSCFQPERLDVELVGDFETDDRWLVVRVRVRGTVESVLEANKNYTTQWIQAATGPKRFLICLSYTIVD